MRPAVIPKGPPAGFVQKEGMELLQELFLHL